jgi:FKBP-type peptidyl-prolyl cis-trans isomerase SlyD
MGDRVKIDYSIMSDGGVIFETSKYGKPLVFTLGKGEVAYSLEKNVLGMKPGEKKNSILLPEEGFGPKMGGLTLTLRRSDLPHDVGIYIGQEIIGQHANGEVLSLFITDINDETVTLDQSPPLAGKTAVLSIEMLEIYEIPTIVKGPVASKVTGI